MKLFSWQVILLINYTFYSNAIYIKSKSNFYLKYYIDYRLLQQNFANWTSKNKFIDKFIQNTQLNVKNKFQILEWIPYNRLENIEFLDKGGFSTIYKAIWLDGPIKKWSKIKNNWIRHKNQKVVLKNLNKSSNLNNEFLNEV